VIAIVGVGAIGGVCAAQLGAVRGDLLCCVRRRFERLSLRGPGGEWTSAPRIATDPAGLDPATWVLLATKAHQTSSAAPWLEALMGTGSTLAVLQNGVEHVERVSRWAGADRVVPVVVDCPATAIAPGRIEQRREARLVVPDDAPGRAFASLFSDTAVEVSPTGDWTTAAWRKLCINAVGGAISALAGRPLAEIREPRCAELARALALECGAVARAEGARVDDDFCAGVAERAATVRSGGRTSILVDRLAGRALEVDARNGAVVRLGARHGIDAWLNRRVCTLLADAHLAPREDRLPALISALPS